jgi:hypothetical protein
MVSLRVTPALPLPQLAAPLAAARPHLSLPSTIFHEGFDIVIKGFVAAKSKIIIEPRFVKSFRYPLYCASCVTCTVQRCIVEEQKHLVLVRCLDALGNLEADTLLSAHGATAGKTC